MSYYFVHVISTVIVPDLLYSLNIINITWGRGKLDDLLGHVRWMSLYPYLSLREGCGSHSYRLYIAS